MELSHNILITSGRGVVLRLQAPIAICVVYHGILRRSEAIVLNEPDAGLCGTRLTSVSNTSQHKRLAVPTNTQALVPHS